MAGLLKPWLKMNGLAVKVGLALYKYVVCGFVLHVQLASGGVPLFGPVYVVDFALLWRIKSFPFAWRLLANG